MELARGLYILQKVSVSILGCTKERFLVLGLMKPFVISLYRIVYVYNIYDNLLKCDELPLCM